MKDDRWLTRLRALAGVGLLGWEAGVEHLQQWWAIFLVVWLLGGPAEDVVRLITDGRLQINIRRGESSPEKKPDDPVDPSER